MWRYHSTCTLEPPTETEEAHPWVSTEPEPEAPEVAVRPETKVAVCRGRRRRDDLAVFGLLDDGGIMRPASLRTLADLWGRGSLGTIGLCDAGRSLATASPRELLGMLGLRG